MKLYPNKLRTIADLEQEKKRLLKEKRKLDKEEIFSLKGVLGKGGGDHDDDSGGGFDIASLIDMLPISNPLVSMGVKMAGRIFSRKKNERNEEKGERSSSKKKSNPVRKIAFEILGGYLKWKAIELSYKGARTYIKKRNEHKRQQRAAGLDD